jgi:UDP:flavonoid glycosyltransferase YjiC (YdhE family)
MATLTLATAGTLGDHLPYVALGSALARRGHAVRLAGSPSQLDAAGRAGLETYPLRPDLSADRARQSARHWDHWSDRRGSQGDRVDPRAYDLAGRYQDLRVACAGSDALLCGSTIPWARLIHETLDLPWLTVSVTPYHFWALGPAEPDPGREARLAALLTSAAAEPEPDGVDYWVLLDAFRTELGLMPQPRSLRRASLFSERVLLLAHPAFVAREELEDGDLRLCDFAFYSDPENAGFQPDPALSEFLAAGEPPVVLCFGSLPLADPDAVLELHAEGARRAGVRLLVQAGWSQLGHGAPSTPELHVTGWLPQDWLFARAEAVIHHGGIGVTARALRHGLPMLVEPFGNDQFWNARQVLAHGVGAALHPHLATADDVARLLRERVLAAPVRERARGLGRRLAAGPGVDAACDQIEAWLPRPRAVRVAAAAATSILIHDEPWGAPLPTDLVLPPGFAFTADRSRLAEAAAVVFHLPTLRALPARKPPGQLWVAFSLECELNYPALLDSEFMARFDLRMTYRLDSDVPVPYLDCFGSPDALLRELEAPPREPARPGLAAAFITSRVDQSRRQAYVSELMRQMPVDSYGGWRRNRTLAADGGPETKRAVIARYAFTLAFENAIAEDYVTEKFFDPLRVGSVPVYLGAPNVARFAPGDGCYIDASAFPEPRALARHLVALHADPAACAALLAWKQRPLRPEFLALVERVRENGWVRLCRELARRLRARGGSAENAPTPRR